LKLGQLHLPPFPNKYLIEISLGYPTEWIVAQIVDLQLFTATSNNYSCTIDAN